MCSAVVVVTNMAGIDSDPLWFKDAVFYQAHVRAFYDANGDGRGDFRGMSQKLDYLKELGVNCIWIMPMYPSPLRDDGYDIADFISIQSAYGTVDDLRYFVESAHQRGIRVIADLVMNHTSDQHAWFQEARRDPHSPKRDYYVWSDDATKYSDARIIFVDTEPSNWTYDPVAGQYYWHRFFSHQPDLNYDSPDVWREMFDVTRFWLRLGLDGFRCDAVPYLYEREGTNGENLPETHGFLRALRRMIDEEFPGGLLLCEANQWPEDVIEYFGTPEEPEFQMGFHFPIMPRLYLCLKREEKSALVEILERTPPIPDNCQWAMFLRNHDELTLEMVTQEERLEMWREYAPDRRMYSNLGIRRRLAPLVDNGRAELELLNMLLFSLPGSPCLYYGDEIGMGDDIYLRDRNGVRTPMQWSSYRNAGFSSAPELYAPVISHGTFNYEAINVEDQRQNPTSLLSWMKRTIAVRQRHPAFGRGSFEMVDSPNPSVFAFVRSYLDEQILCVANLCSAAQLAELNLQKWVGCTLSDLIGGASFGTLSDSEFKISVGPRGYYWLKLDRADE